MNGDIYGFSPSDLHGNHDDELVIDAFLTEHGLFPHGSGVAKMAKVLAILLREREEQTREEGPSRA